MFSLLTHNTCFHDSLPNHVVSRDPGNYKIVADFLAVIWLNLVVLRAKPKLRIGLSTNSSYDIEQGKKLIPDPSLLISHRTQCAVNPTRGIRWARGVLSLANVSSSLRPYSIFMLGLIPNCRIKLKKKVTYPQTPIVKAIMTCSYYVFYVFVFPVKTERPYSWVYAFILRMFHKNFPFTFIYGEKMSSTNSRSFKLPEGECLKYTTRCSKRTQFNDGEKP